MESTENGMKTFSRIHYDPDFNRALYIEDTQDEDPDLLYKIIQDMERENLRAEVVNKLALLGILTVIFLTLIIIERGVFT